MVSALAKEFREYWSFKPVRVMFLVRLLSYLSIYITPFWGMILAIYFDAWDWDYLQKYNMPKHWYHRIDKVVDYIEYIVILPLMFFTPVFYWYVGFLIWRTLGTLLYFFAKTKDSIFVLFPNVAEYIALFYFMSVTFSLGWNVVSAPWLLGIVIYKLAVELQLHYFKAMLPVADKPQPALLKAFAKFNQAIIK